jgi:hypothetical protein
MAQAPKEPVRDGGADFVRHIVSDPKNVPDVMLLTGYLGASSEEGHERLYTKRDLSDHIDIPKPAILHHAPLPKEQDAYGGVTLWVKKDAALKYKMAPGAQALANYFAGAIQAAAAGAAAGAAAPPFTHAPCGATLVTPCFNTHANTCGCITTQNCVTQGASCAAGGACTYVGCGASLACTYGLVCASQGCTAQCPSQACSFGCGLTQVCTVQCTVKCAP